MDIPDQTNLLNLQKYNALVGASVEETAINCEKVLGLLSSQILLNGFTPNEDEKEAIWLIMNMVREALKFTAPQMD